MLAAAKHPDVARGLAVLWISGGVFGLFTLAMHYCAPSLQKAWVGGMEAVAALPEWAEVLERNPRNRQRLLDQDPDAFIATMERWMLAYVPREHELVPGLPLDVAQRIAVPTLVFRSGESDAYHTRATSEAVAKMIPCAQLVEPPWPDTEWNDGSRRRSEGTQTGAFERWPLLAPQLFEWAATLPS